MVLEPSTGGASRTPLQDASNASDAALLDSARRFRRISLVCNLMSSFTLGRLNGSSSTSGFAAGWS